jgi:phosphopantothenoylcysteine decarboxylase/phosphopantothenate--cysteine ligase
MSRVLLCCGASVSIYKACDLASRLTQAGHEVRVALTENAARLVSPQLFAAVTGQPAATTEWGHERSTAMDHIEWARWAQVAVVAPASADLAARLALGIANDLVTSIALALDPAVPRVLCPAMNPTMLAAAAVQRNLATLASDGWSILAPGEGHLACGEVGAGRLAEPDAIAVAVEAALAGA